MNSLILALRRIMEQPKVNTQAALRLTMEITKLDPSLFDQLGIYENGEWRI